MAGSVIGTQATASYVDSTNTARSVASNLVQTMVVPVKSFTLTANGAKNASPGQTVYYPHTITNTGNGTDTYALTTPTATTGSTVVHSGMVYYMDANSDGVPDNATPITSTGPLAAGAQFSFVVAGVVPSNANATTAPTGAITVGATDTGSNSATNTDTTTVTNSVVNVTQALSSTSGAAGATLTLTLSYSNSGTVDASTLTMSDVLPSGMAYVANSGRWSGSGSTVLTDGSGGDTGIDYTFTGSTVKAIIPTVPVGMSGTVSFSVTVGAALTPTTLSNAALTTTMASYTTATQSVSANTNSVTFTVRQSGAVVVNANPAAASVGSYKTATVASASPGATVTFTDYIWNTGNASDTFNVTLAAVAGFPTGTTFALFQADGITSLLDSNGDGVPDTGPLASNPSNATGTRFTVIVKAFLPYGASITGGPYTQRLSATSVFDPSKSDLVDNTLTAISANIVDLTSAAYAITAGGYGANTTTPSTSVTILPNSTATTQARFPLYVTNLGAVADSYTLSATSAIPNGWSVAFASDCSGSGSPLTSTGTLAAAVGAAAGGSQMVCALVTVPTAKSALATVGDQLFTFKVQSALTLASDTLVDKVTVSALHSVALSPNGAQQTYPGGAVLYSHTLSNNGNGAELVTYPVLSDSQVAAGWTSVLYVAGSSVPVASGSSVTLQVNDSVALLVRVFVPGSASTTGPLNVTTLSASYNTGAASVAATDATTVTDALLLLKEQQSFSCGPPAPTVLAANYSTAAIAATPGQCIAYRITSTNMTATTINTVLVSDTVPANTTRNDACFVPLISGASGTIGGTASSGTGGTVTASIGTLAPTASFQLTFCVKINQ